MSAYTAGPWRPFLWCGGAFGVTAAPLSEPRGGEITEIVYGPRGGSSEANARLIAASPDLLEAARAVVERWDTPNWKDAAATAEYINALRAAIAKAGAA